MITGDQKQQYLDLFNKGLTLDLELADLKMLTELDVNGEPNAVAGFFNSSQYNIEGAIASKQGWSGNKSFAIACFDYAFVRCEAWRMTCYVRASNAQSIMFQERLGFKREFDGVLKNWFGSEDGIQFVMFKNECKWLKETKK